jgi:phage/plasmid primase-like uncharacterized protein
MTLEKTTAKVITETAKLAEAALKKAWSIMDAAAEKKSPSEYLSQTAIKAMQGASEGK